MVSEPLSGQILSETTTAHALSAMVKEMATVLHSGMTAYKDLLLSSNIRKTASAKANKRSTIESK